MQLKGKTILLGITGGIAANKMANLSSPLMKVGCKVIVAMSKNATEFIAPLTFETLTGERVLLDTFDRNFPYNVEHVEIAKRVDCVLIAPATANLIAKASHGIADDMLTTTLLACRCPRLIAPAMNTNMYENPITQDNLKRLQAFGITIIPPERGRLACGDIGSGKLPCDATLLTYLERALTPQTLVGKKVLVTAGATQEAIDPVRYITNHSTGKMGYAIAKMAALRGATVTLVSGKTALPIPELLDYIEVTSAEDMYQAVTTRSESQDIIIMAAAVADYRPEQVSEEKIKKTGDTSLRLLRTRDILATLGEQRREGQLLCGFAMETENLLENARQKLQRKHVDLLCANSLRQNGAGFGVDTNIVTLLTPTDCERLPLLSKEEVAVAILDKLSTL